MAKYVSTVAFIDAKDLAEVNKGLEAVGYGPDFFSVPLDIGKAGKVTHYGCSARLADSQLARLQTVIDAKRAKGAGKGSDPSYDTAKSFADSVKDKGGAVTDKDGKPPKDPDGKAKAGK